MFFLIVLLQLYYKILIFRLHNNCYFNISFF